MSGSPERDSHDLFLDLVFVLRPDGDRVQVTDPAGRTRTVDAPWRTSSAWTAARLGFDDLARHWLTEDGDRRMLVRDARILGRALFDVLFGEPGLPLLAEALMPGRPRPLLVVRSDDDALLALPWELIHYDGAPPGRSVPLSSFLVGDGYLDVARTTLDEVAEGALLHPPQGTFKLVVNVSAPQTNTPLSYEKESYRITISLTEHCRPVPTELGTLDDLVQTVASVKPTGIHFSGHGYRGGLAFEGEEGEDRQVPTGELITRLRAGSDGRLPPFFYLASCHGNEPQQDGAESSAAQLHRAGVAQVVGYFGPIHDQLSTRAEAALYAAIAEGQTTNNAVRQARQALATPFAEADVASHPRDKEGQTLPSYLADAGLLPRTRAEPSPAADQARHGMPFAWAQLVLYHRGPDYPLSVPVAAARRRADDEVPVRESEVDPSQLLLDEPLDTPRRLMTGFIGRRRELHMIRRKKRREGARTFVFQGLGGLGKTTLAFHMLSLLGEPEDVCTLWCHLAEKQPDKLEALVEQLLDYCRKRVDGWDVVVAQVDREVGADAARRFLAYVDRLLQAVPRLVLYLDNLESLMNGPPDDDSQPPRPEAFAEWQPPQAGGLWRALRRLARDNRKLYLVASCRYCHADFGDDRMPVERLTDDALYRMMEWFPGLRRLAALSRAVLVARLNGHPRQVEYANDLIESRLAQWTFPRERTKDYVQREWTELVEPVLPRAQGKLWDNLLLGAIWQRVLNDRERRMLYRMTLLRRPWIRELSRLLGEAEESESLAEATEKRLERTSLLEVRAGQERDPLFTLHPTTTQYIECRFPPDEPLRLATHRRLGAYLEAGAKRWAYIDMYSEAIEWYSEAGYHLFQAGEYDRAQELLVPASAWWQLRGEVRAGLAILEPFLEGDVCKSMKRELVGQLHDRVGRAYARLGQTENAIGYYDQRLQIAREIKDRRGEGDALANLGIAYADLGQADKALGFSEQWLQIAREIKDRRGEGDALANLGRVHADLGQTDKAIGYCERALVISREIKDCRRERDALGNLGHVHADLGQTDKAIGYFEQALVISREIKAGRQGYLYRESLMMALAVLPIEIEDRRSEWETLGNLGNAYYALGQTDKSIGYCEQALVISREIKDRSRLTTIGAAIATTASSLALPPE